ncbi:uncharacterized protein PAC_16701 [Phialocephala subalpina]|uniref:BTB domain-containing protein n=1 Tax=Phialocephala subalpina TaxID=576137 RepID=A0A1L7XP22_9HELO|nr:uncharacterized protein PAC_16701 [Phialocephala subalpina]
MATIFIHYDPKGDVELILEKQDIPHTNQTPASPSNKQGAPTKCTVGPVEIKVNKFRLRVSSHKLISSSRYFQAMLEGPGFREQQELKEKGFVAVELLDPEDNPTAMIVILGILQGNKAQVPEEWHELVKPSAIAWFTKLANDPYFLHTLWKDTLWQCLWIAWVFGMKDHFKLLSEIAQGDGRAPIDLTDESIRLPSRIIKAINDQRDAAFQKIEQTVDNFRKDLLDSRRQSDDRKQEKKMIRRMVLGDATFCSQALKIGEYATPDHNGSSVYLLKDRIERMQSTTGFFVHKEGSNGRDDSFVPVGGPFDLKHALQKAIDELKIEAWGLDYDDFKPTILGKRPASAVEQE